MRTGLRNLLMSLNCRKTAVDVEEELQFHIEMLERNYAQQGMSGAHAKAAALRRFGNFEKVKKQCVEISRRNSQLRRILKTSLILIALCGLSIRTLSSDYRVARIGAMLIMIAIASRLLLYVRGLSSRNFLPGTKQTSLSLFTDTPDDALRQKSEIILGHSQYRER
jgi:hypothetical protein